jgi:HAD superfamily hydrolase (TIGR01490 family)
MTKRIAFFDLDGTILQGLSSERVFFFHLIKKRHLGIWRLFKYWLSLVKSLPKHKFRIFIKNKAYLAGFSEDEIKQLAEKFVTKNLLPRIHPALIQKIEQHRASNDILVLLTGTPYFLAEVFARHLNIEHVEATYCVLENNYFTEESPTQSPFAEEKLAIAEKLCQQYQADIKDCVAYGNSIHDAPLLAAVGLAIAVDPDKKLHKLAEKNNWEII